MLSPPFVPGLLQEINIPGFLWSVHFSGRIYSCKLYAFYSVNIESGIVLAQFCRFKYSATNSHPSDHFDISIKLTCHNSFGVH